MNTFRYPLAGEAIDMRIIDALCEWLKTNPQLTKGNLTQRFEDYWSTWLGVNHTLFCNSGSSANLLALNALLAASYTSADHKAVVPSVGWVTSISPFIQLGIEPIMCEADPHTFGLDADYLETLLVRNPAINVVMLVQVLGVPNAMEDILYLQEHFGFHLIEDACAAAGSTYHGRKVGTFGNISTNSTYFGHQLPTIEGGTVSTNNSLLYETLLMLRSHGWLKDLPESARNQYMLDYNIDPFHEPFTFILPGYNLRPTEIQAFIGIEQLKTWEAFILKRFENHNLYRDLLKDFVTMQHYDADSIISSIHFGALAQSTEERKAIVTALTTASIETRIFSAGNLGLHPFWQDLYGIASFPVADSIHYRGFFLPNNHTLSKEDITFIADVVIQAIQQYRNGGNS